MADNPAAVLGIRQKNHCVRHALDAASRYYAAALPRSLALLSRTKKLQETRAGTPRRVQPARGVKRASASTTKEEVGLKPGVRRRVERLLTEVPLPVEDGVVLGEERWREEVEGAVLGALTGKMTARGEGGGACGFGGRTWGCVNCGRERAEAREREGVVEGGADGPGDGERAEVAAMGGPVVVESVGAEGWWDVEIPEGEIRRVGGLRFVVDVCGDGLVMFV